MRPGRRTSGDRPRRLLVRLGLGLAVLVALLATGPALVLADRGLGPARHWYEADRSSAGLAPAPAAHPGAVVQVYAARAFRWRGVLAVHTWVATKAPGARRYRVYQVTRWSPAAVASAATPDRAWFGSAPRLLLDLRGPAARELVAPIDAAAARYPWAGRYRVWPGPNSNTFTAWLVRAVDGLELELPPTAIGKDYLGGEWVAPAPSGTGYQVSLAGLVGIGVAAAEGLEVNLLGLVIGVDPGEPALKLPGLGRVGPGARASQPP